ncbi:putative inactive disease susceptibility protein LOV1 [Solanum stenotomum]|uniref:putative inactive disease susceptibility protein LOV1 n=1 Tax=Solanum stenotomum TaxID=172797 RepID=UPI0020D15907|nr:putative inactive disease susceptibility protein LOV1 [Solanum stenotomum]XP_049398572.1 putative inactive disease susceptibility protein LOV1 [Solanum stenotomum]
MELAAEAFVVIEKLKDTLSGEITNKRVIEKALEEMQGVIADTNKEQRNSEEFKEWAEGCLLSLYCVEDTVESFALGIARQNKKWSFLMNHSQVLKNFMACKLTKKMERIPSDIKQVINKNHKGTGEQNACSSGTTTYMGNQNGGEAEDGDIEDHNGEDSAKVRLISPNAQCSYPTIPEREELVLGVNRKPLRCISDVLLRLDHEKQAKLMSTNIPLQCIRDKAWWVDHVTPDRLMYINSFDDEELEMFGIAQEVYDLVERLTTRADDGRALIVQIDGKMGSGKTTLACAVYRNRKIRDHFENGCAWVTISEEFNKSDVLQNLLKQVGDSKDSVDLTTNELETRLLECLNGKKYLIVLDDVQNDQMWEGLRSVFLDSRNGSTLLLITTSVSPMWYVSLSNCIHKVKKLSETYSWKLFMKKAGWDIWEKGKEHQDLKQRVLDVCCGLPLNIVLLGSMLLLTKGDTNRFDFLQKILRRNWETKDIVSLCYTNLPDHLKLCVLYLVLFPKKYAYDIPVRRLFRLWLSEGFVNPKPDKFPEDVVQENFDDLVKRSLIQISKFRSDGSPRRCRLLGVLHDYLLPKAQNIRFFDVHRSTCSTEDSFPLNVRRLVEHANSKNIYSGASQFEHLRSYLAFNFQRKDTPAKEVGILLSRVITKGFGLLRVLDLEGVYKPSLPENLGDLLHLRYLGLRWTFLDALPLSVGDLPYLETLDVKHTNINNLPTSMWKSKKLRHLNLSHIRLDMPKHSDTDSLPTLLTLWGLSVDDDSPVKNGLDRLCNLREAGITFCLSNCDHLLNWISKLTSLQSLRLRSINDVGHPSHFGKNPLYLSSLSNLSHLNLLGKLPNLPKNLPQGLKVVTLSLSKLTEDPMPILGKLEHLNVLRLLSDSYMGKELVCPQGGFKELLVLKIWKLKNLEKWNVEGAAMEKLKEINIRCCNKLMSIPERLRKKRSLRELIITNMPEEFKEDVHHQFMSRWDLILTFKDYDFTPLPWEHADHTSDESHTNE